MQALGIFVALALLSFSLAVPVIDILKDEELRNDMLSENSALHVQKMTKECKKYLISYGYVPAKSKSLRDFMDGLWRFAVWNGAKMKKKLFMSKIGLDVFTRRLMSMSKKRRCGNPDIGEGSFQPKMKKRQRVRRYSAQTPWGENTLTYKIESFDDSLSQEVQRQEIAKAFKLWTDASELTVSEVQGSANADIKIKFVAGEHSDSAPFDGPGLVVAHAFYPEEGRVHFDSDETYTTGGEANKVNLLSVAAHEIGHALGLGHSTHSDAIMYAQYQPYSPSLALAQDDIDGIKYLYPSNTAGQCVDEHWCEDILENECSYFVGYCKKKCGTCDT